MLAQTSDDRLLVQCDDKQAMIDWCGYLNYAIEIATGNISAETLKQLYEEVGESRRPSTAQTLEQEEDSQESTEHDSNLGGVDASAAAETGGEGSTSLSASQRAMISESGAKPPVRASVMAGAGVKKQTRVQLRKKSNAAANARRLELDGRGSSGRDAEQRQHRCEQVVHREYASSSCN